MKHFIKIKFCGQISSENVVSNTTSQRFTTHNEDQVSQSQAHSPRDETSPQKDHSCLEWRMEQSRQDLWQRHYFGGQLSRGEMIVAWMRWSKEKWPDFRESRTESAMEPRHQWHHLRGSWMHELIYKYNVWSMLIQNTIIENSLAWFYITLL
jgi:hypothetical protein